MTAAERTNDRLLIAGGPWRLAGRLTESADVPVNAAEVLRSQLNSPQVYSVYGSLMLKGAVGAATAGDHKAVRDYLAVPEQPLRSN